MSELKANGLSVILKKDGTPLVQRLSFSLTSGESLILLGQSGCGKTLTCRTVTGILDRTRFRTEGSLVFDGHDLLSLPEKERTGLYGRKIVFVPQNPMTALDPSVRIGRQLDETLRIHLKLTSAQRRERVLRSLTSAGLKDVERVCAAYPHMLSGGMLQRVLIASAISTDAELVVADEPTTALDVVHRNEIVDCFLDLRRSGKALLFVTHDFAAALRLGGNILVLRNGSVVEQGSTRSVYDAPKEEYTRALVRASALSKGEKYAVR